MWMIWAYVIAPYLICAVWLFWRLRRKPREEANECIEKVENLS